MVSVKNYGWDLFDKALKENAASRIYIWGDPGLGKSRTSQIAMNGINLDVKQVTLNEDLMVQELIGHYVPAGNKFVWQDGPVAAAMRGGGLVINELPRAAGAVRDMFLGVLDDPEVALISLTNGTNLAPHNRFTVVATGNQSPDDARLDPALLDRFEMVIFVDVPHPGLVNVLNSTVGHLGDVVLDSFKDGRSGRVIAPRQAFAWAKAARIFGEETAALAIFKKQANDFLNVLRLRQSVK